MRRRDRRFRATSAPETGREYMRTSSTLGGIVNKAAGEECDDGNRNDTDHCSNPCKIQ